MAPPAAAVGMEEPLDAGLGVCLVTAGLDAMYSDWGRSRMLVLMPPPPPSRSEERIWTLFVVVGAGAGSAGPRMLFRIADLTGCTGACLGASELATGSTRAGCFNADFFFLGFSARDLPAGLYSSSDDRWLRSICSRCCRLNCDQYDVA